MNHLRRDESNSKWFAETHTARILSERNWRSERLSTFRRTSLAFILIAASLSAFTGCSNQQSPNASSPTPLISVAITQVLPPSLMVGASVQVSAQVNNDIANAGVDWVATCTSPPNCGSFSPTHTASGASTTFTAPLAVPAKKNIAVTALSATDHGKASIANVALFSNVQEIILTFQPPASLPAGSLLLLGARVDGDASYLGVDWTATCQTVDGPLKCSPSGLHSPAGGTIALTVPQTVSTQSVVGTSITVTGASTADPSFTVSFMVLVTDPVSISITQAPPATLLTSATAPVIAVVNNDTTNSGVTWAVSCQASDCGMVTPVQTASGVAASYTAPATVPSPNPPPGLQVRITASSTATGVGTQSSVVVSIVAPISVKITQSIINNIISLNAGGSLVAIVSNDDTAKAGVDWTASCGSPGACGSFSPTHTASGATTTFTAPAAIPAGGTINITASSTTDPTGTDHQVVTVTAAPPPNSLLQGRFVVLLSARNSLNGPFVLGGVISGDGIGNISAGVFDLADEAGNSVPSALFPVVTPSSYSIGADGRGQIQLTLETVALNNNFGVAGPNHTSTINMSVVFASPQHALLTETDSFGNATGTMDLQNATDLAAFQAGTSGLSGTYSLQLAGAQPSLPYPYDFIAAALLTQGSGASFTLTGYTADQSANGAIVSAPFTSASQGLSTLLDQTGKIGWSSVNLGLTTTLNLDVWLIDANHFVVVDWQDSSSAFFGGYMTAQSAAPSISGAYAFTEAGATLAAQPQVAGGIFTCGATGVLDVVPLAGTAVNDQSINATCAAPNNGRSVIAISGAATAGLSQFAAYPTMDRGLYIIELDGGASGNSGPSGAGIALQQTSNGPIAASALSGNRASNFSASTAIGSEAFVARLIFDGVSALSGTADVNSFDAAAAPPAARPTLNSSISGMFTAGSGDGRFTTAITFRPAGGQPIPQITTLNSACYIVDPNTCLILGLDVTAPGSGISLLQTGF